MVGEVKLTISKNTPSQKNGKQIYINKATNRPFITSNQRVKDWHREAYFELTKQFEGLKVTDYPIELSVVFWRDSKRKYDLDNAYSSVADALTRAGVIEDDNINFISCVTLQHGGIDRENPRAEVFLNE